jgi:hypothetical protein
MLNFSTSDALTGSADRYEAIRVPLAIGAVVIQEVNHDGVTSITSASVPTTGTDPDATSRRANFYKSGGQKLGNSQSS